ncbi:MAG: leucine-rich repeat protein [Sphaerochaetaceae bacterium]|nr:leucine-rich repeat protein [Sphaerochaetaceae bacterium]
MKRALLFALSLLVVVSCSKFDDSAIWDELNKHEDRIVKLETLCNQMNTNITSLQTIIIALQGNDYVVNIAPIKEGDKEIGYTITFAKSGSITIYHGKDGKNGQDGADGKDGQNGKDGYTPIIGVKQHTDGKYYWTLDGKWLLDDSGNMIPTTGEDGQDGTDGKDGITPQFKIEDGYWYLSYDNGASWQKLDKATGNNGCADGYNIIDSITQNDDNVYFNLTDGTLITLHKQTVDTIIFEDLQVKALCCKNWDTDLDGELSYKEAAAVNSIGTVFKGNTSIVSFNELEYFTGLKEISESAFRGCSSLWKIRIPSNVEVIKSSAFRYCESLIDLKITSKIKSIGSYAFADCNFKKIEVDASNISGITRLTDIFENTACKYCLVKSDIPAYMFADSEIVEVKIEDGVTSIGDYAFNNVPVQTITLPNSLVTIGDEAFYGNKITGDIILGENVRSIGISAFFAGEKTDVKIYCKSLTPPTLADKQTFFYKESSSIYQVACEVIYVPSESYELYTTDAKWSYHYKEYIKSYNF